jgi:putative ABC transport system permease protein
LRTVDLDYRGANVKLFATEMRMLASGARLTVLEGDADEVYDRLEHGEVVVSENFAQRFGVRAGDALSLPTRAGLNPFRVAAVVLDYTSDLGTILLDRSTYVEHWADERVDTFELRLADGVAPERVRARIDEDLGERFDLFVLTNREFRAALTAAADQVFSLMRILEVVSLLVALLGLLTTILAGVMDRVRELGVFRAIGMLRHQVVSLVMTEAILIGVLGTVGGTLLGFASSYILLKHVVTAQTGWVIPYHVPTSMLAILYVLIPCLAAVAAVLPARRAAALQLRDALGYE